MESEGMLFEAGQVPMDDIEYAADQIRRGVSLRQHSERGGSG
jgi:hypothetical protein